MQNIFNRLVHASTRLARQARRLISSYGRSARFNEVPPRRVDIDCRIYVPVMVCAALWAIPFSNVEAETGQNVAAAMASLGRGEEAVHKPQLPAVSLTFVCEHLTELPERSIGDRFGETMVFDHTSHVQVFDADSVVSTHQIGGHFVQVILSGVTDVFLDAGNADALPVPSAASFCATGEDPLGLGKTRLVFARMLWIGDSLIVAGSSQTVYPKINPDRFPGRFELGKLFVQDQRDEVASAGFFNDRDGRGFRLELPAPVHIETTQTGDNQVRVLGIGSGKLESGSRVFGALLVSLPLEHRIPSLLVKEPHEGVIQMSERLLGRNAGDFPQPRGFLLPLPFGEFGGGLVVSNPFLPLLPSVSPIPERPVVDIPAAPEDLGKLRLLGRSWCPTELVSNLHTNNLYA